MNITQTRKLIVAVLLIAIKHHVAALFSAEDKNVTHDLLQFCTVMAI